MAREKCRARSKSTGQQCGNWAVEGLTVCRIHGGATAAAKAKAARAVERAGAEAAARQFGILIDTSPQQALLDEVQRAAGMVAYYGARVEEIANEDAGKLVRGITKIENREGFQPGRTSTVEPGVHVWVTLWNEERDRLTRVAAAAIRAGIEERRVELAEQQGLMIAAVIRRILGRLELSPSQQVLVGEVVPDELRALGAGV